MRTFLTAIAVAASAACSSSSAPKILAGTDVLVSVKLLSGASQQGTVGKALALPIIIQAVDSSGNPIVGLPVIYGPSDGSLNPSSAVTDNKGMATTVWTLGSRTGPDTLFAAVTQNGTGNGPPIATVVDTIYATANP